MTSNGKVCTYRCLYDSYWPKYIPSYFTLVVEYTHPLCFCFFAFVRAQLGGSALWCMSGTDFGLFPIRIFNDRSWELDQLLSDRRAAFCYKLPSVEWPTNQGLTLPMPGSGRRMWPGELDFPWLHQTLLQQNVPVWCEPQDCHNAGSRCHRFRQKSETNYENQIQISVA